MICPLCNSTISLKKSKKFFECGHCKAIVKDPVYYYSGEAEERRYKAHNNDVNDVRYQKFTSPITEHVLQNFLPEHKGLDFGCGTGPVISKMLTDRNYTVFLYDPFFAPNEEALEQTYDYIFSCEVFEHFYYPRKEITMLEKMLKPGGSLLIMTLLYNDEIDFSRWSYTNDPTHVFFYREETIQYIAQEFGFDYQLFPGRLIQLKKKFPL